MNMKYTHSCEWNHLEVSIVHSNNRITIQSRVLFKSACTTYENPFELHKFDFSKAFICTRMELYVCLVSDSTFRNYDVCIITYILYRLWSFPNSASVTGLKQCLFGRRQSCGKWGIRPKRQISRSKSHHRRTLNWIVFLDKSEATKPMGNYERGSRGPRS